MKKCEVCSKGSMMVSKRKKLRGKYNPVNTHRVRPNLQKTKLPDGTRILACTSCIKKAAKKSK